VRTLLLCAVMACSGCAIRQPGLQTYRLVPVGADSVLVPPGVKGAAVKERAFLADVPAKECQSVTGGAISIRVRAGKLRITLHREELEKEPANWLSAWAARLEEQGCTPAGSSWKLASEIADSIPLDTRAAFRLLYGDAVDIGPQLRIEVDSPILRDEFSTEPLIEEFASTAANGSGLKVNLKASSNLIGYERAWFGVQAKTGASGLRIVPTSAERHIGDITEQHAQPAKNYFTFAPEAGYYRLIYKQQETNFTALVVAGRTQDELDRFAKTLDTGVAGCASVESGFCVAIPRNVAANLYVPVTVNGKEQMVHWGAKVGELLHVNRAEAMTSLTVTRLRGGIQVPVEFERTARAILGLELVGGETVSWH